MLAVVNELITKATSSIESKETLGWKFTLTLNLLVPWASADSWIATRQLQTLKWSESRSLARAAPAQSTWPISWPTRASSSPTSWSLIRATGIPAVKSGTSHRVRQLFSTRTMLLRYTRTAQLMHVSYARRRSHTRGSSLDHLSELGFFLIVILCKNNIYMYYDIKGLGKTFSVRNLSPSLTRVLPSVMIWQRKWAEHSSADFKGDLTLLFAQSMIRFVLALLVMPMSSKAPAETANCHP